MSKQPCVYILASQRNGTLYIGVTSDLVRRVWEHKNDLAEDSPANMAFTLSSISSYMSA
jgi:predicted GIY-YIG superfamily endonuclease